MSATLQIYSVKSGASSGIGNMALDEALLESVRAQAEPVLIVRTYRWQEPTLSLGVNQQVRDIQFLLKFYGKPGESGEIVPVRSVVRRPTGGRAILHGEDISYSFITNDPTVLKLSLKESYSVYAEIVRVALQQLALTVQAAGDAGERDYLRSPVCFETHTPSDLLGKDGQKLTGSAQLRRAGGLLQHGAAFLAPYGVDELMYNQALFEATAQAFQQPVQPFPAEAFTALMPQLKALQADYAKDSGEILAKAPTIKGSHLVPDSF
jgi:lipoate-protein ligase A